MLLCAAGVRAEPREVPPAVQADTPEQHFRAGVEHFRARRYREAIRELELAASQLPSAELWFDLGRAHEELGEDALAVASYERYLRDRVDAPDAAEVQHRIDALRERARAATAAANARAAKPTTLAIEAHDPATAIRLDGRALDGGATDRMVEVTPGRHALQADRKGYVPLRAQPDILPGSLNAAYVDLRPLARPVPSQSRSRPLIWTSAGLCAASVVATGAFGWAALSARQHGDLAEGRSFSTASAVALGSAVVFAIAATVAYIVAGHASAHDGANVCDRPHDECWSAPGDHAASQSLDPFEAAMISPRSTEISAASSNSVDSAPTR